LNFKSEPVPPAPIGARILQLDGLRGLAIFLVLIWHYVAITALAPRGSLAARVVAALRLTWSGVDLFFVLSGFLIGGILIDERASGSYFRTFYARRFFRIIPLYAVICALFGAAALAGGQQWGRAGAWVFTDAPPWYAFVLFLQNFFAAFRGTFEPLSVGVMWSLAVEEQFYATLPLLVRFLPARRLLPVLVGLVAVVPVARSLAFFSLAHGFSYAYNLMPLRADALLLGVIVAILVRRPDAWAALVRHRSRVRIVTAVLGLGVLGFARWAPNFADPPLATVGYTWIALFYASVLVLAITRDSGSLSTVLRMRWLRALGGIAYGTYLLHTCVQGALFGVFFGSEPKLTNLPELGVTLLSVAVTVILAQASWTFFEKRMVRRGHDFHYEPA
jgi:peptidoglycan/LPS O-acetylase OafA/YrhL